MLKPLRKILLTTLGILPMMVPFDNARAAEKSEGGQTDYMASASEVPWRKARLSLEAQTGTRTFGTLDAMLPFMGNDDLIVYADLIGQAATSDKAWAGSLGLGFRRVNDAETSIFGMYAFYDLLKSVNNNQFTQVTVGAERLGLTWDFRANAYLPVGKNKHVKTIYDGASLEIVGNDIIQYVQSFQEQLHVGGDVEMGRTLGSNKVRGYLAMYTFGENLTGPRTRVEYQVSPRWALNATVQHDQTRKTQYFLGVRFTVGGAKAANSDSIYARLTDPVVRNIDIVTKSGLTDQTQVATDKFWMVDQGKTTPGGAGTVADPFANLHDAVAAAPEGAIIYIKGANGTLTQNQVQNVGGNVQLKPGHILAGGKEDLYFDFASNKVNYTPGSNSLLLMNGNGIMPTISGTLIANSNVGIHNLNLIADSLTNNQAGITINSAQNVVISNVNISGFNAEDGIGVSILGKSQVSFNNVTARNNYIGLYVEDSQVTVTNALKLDQNQFAALQLSNSQMTVDNLTITNSGQDQDGVLAAFGSTLNVSGNLSINGGIRALWAQSGATINASNVTVSNGNIIIDAAILNAAQALNVHGAASDKITVSNGGSVNANNATVNIGHMNFNQGFWSGSNNIITLNGTASTPSLLVQNGSKVNFTTATTNSVDLEDTSVLTISNALTSNGDIMMTGGTLNGDSITANSNISVNAGTLLATNSLTVNASETQQISVLNGGSIATATAAITTGDINVSGTNSSILVNGGAITTHSLELSNAAQLIDQGTTSLIVNGVAADSFSLDSGAQLSITNLTVNNSNIIVDGAGTQLMADVLTATAAAAPNSYQVSITNGANVIATDPASSITTNQVILNNGILALADGALTVTNSSADGVLLSGNSLLAVNQLTVNNSKNSGIHLVDGTVQVGTIESSLNAEHGIFVAGGSITSTGAVTSTSNGSDLLPNMSIGHGLSITGGSVNFASFTATKNWGDGIHQTEGKITIGGGSLSHNLYNEGLQDGGNGFVKTGGTVQSLAGVTIENNEQVGLSINNVAATSSTIPDFIASSLTVKNNAAEGILLNNGNMQLANINVTQNNPGDTAGTYSNQVVVSGTGTQILTLVQGAKASTISLGGAADTSGAQLAQSAVLINSANATVTLSGVNISNNTNGVGVWVNKGTVTLNALTSNNNQRAVVFIEGALTINNARISNNSEYGIVAQNIDDKTPTNRTLNLTNVSINSTGVSELAPTGAGYGLALVDATTLTYNGGTISGNTKGGLFLNESNGISLSNLTIQNNIGNGIDLNYTGIDALTLNITDTQINNNVKQGETPQQLIGINANVAGAFTALLDNTQITYGQGDGMNITATNAINMTVQNGSNISHNQGNGVAAHSKTQGVNLNVTGKDSDNKIQINNNLNDGIAIQTDVVGAQSKLNLTHVMVDNNGNAGLYVSQLQTPTKVIINLIDTEIKNNKYGVWVTGGILAGQVDLFSKNILLTQTNKLPGPANKQGDWEFITN